MVLVDCQECGGKVSTKAKSCPHCGAPVECPKPTQELKAQEVEALTSLRATTSTLNPPAESVKEKPASPDPVDDFGLSLTNPVPSSSIGASYAYLELLATPDKQRIHYERLGPKLKEEGVYIDHYSISDSKGQYICDIFINAYAGHDTEMAPQGLEYFRPLKGMFDRPENQKLKTELLTASSKQADSGKTNFGDSSGPTTIKNQDGISGKPGRRRPIEIGAQSVYLACKAIHGHLKPYFDDGWVCGNAVCLADGWRNEYNLTKRDQSIKLEFDLRPSLVAIASDPAGSIPFVVSSMSLAKPQGMEKIKENLILQGDRDALADQSFFARYLLKPIAHIVFFGVIIWFVYECSGN